MEIDTTKLDAQLKQISDYVKNLPVDEMYSWIGIFVGVFLTIIGIILML